MRRDPAIRNEVLIEDEPDDAWPDCDVVLTDMEENCTMGPRDG